MSVIGTLKGSSTIMYTTLQHQPWWSSTPRPGLELASEVTPFAERKGLVMLQPSTCRHGRNLSPMRFMLFIVLSWSGNYGTMCLAHYLTAMLNLIIGFLDDKLCISCSMTRLFLSLQRSCKTSLEYGCIILVTGQPHWAKYKFRYVYG